VCKLFHAFTPCQTAKHGLKSLLMQRLNIQHCMSKQEEQVAVLKQ
jgi:hypothetical protein